MTLKDGLHSTPVSTFYHREIAIAASSVRAPSPSAEFFPTGHALPQPHSRSDQSALIAVGDFFLGCGRCLRGNEIRPVFDPTQLDKFRAHGPMLINDRGRRWFGVCDGEELHSRRTHRKTFEW